MESAQMIEGIRRISEEMAVDASRDLDAQVVHCPAWTVRDLVTHIGEVQWFWSFVMDGGHTSRPELPEPRGLPKGADPMAWFREQTQKLTSSLDTCADDLHLWTWWEPLQNAWFVKQRQLNEVAVHAWDARNAVGDPRPIDADMAVVGLQEFVDVMAKDITEGTNPAPVRLQATDIAWAETIFASDQPTHDQLTLADSASNLLLTLWGRHPVPNPEIEAALRCVDLS
jgi:uncharacterized protein (TIGR03083 family)